ncbi:MAG: Y-family DNA polymerase [Hyphomicrobium sp.]
MTRFALVDCNNFYVSCERLFQPNLRDRPVVVLSNNDGCIISRSQEAKTLGIKMGAPLFKVRDIIKKNDIKVCSSNYALYGDISERVMQVLGASAPNQEIYSIDESFLDVDCLANVDLTDWCQQLRKKVLRWTGIPVSIGIGTTKTLAKLANRMAKKSILLNGVLDLTLRQDLIESALLQTPVEDIWGIGRKWSEKLHSISIHTAFDFSKMQDGWIQKRMGVVGLRTAQELRGHTCYMLEDNPSPKKTTCCSRTFGHVIHQKNQVQDAVVSFAERASEKIRRDGQVAGAIQLYLRTDPFNHAVRQRAVSGAATFIRPTSDSREIIKTVLRVFESIWCEGFGWRKAGVLLIDLASSSPEQRSLFEECKESNTLMNAIDSINDRFGRGSARLGLSPQEARWRTRSGNVSPSFTTRWAEIPTAKLG